MSLKFIDHINRNDNHDKTINLDEIKISEDEMLDIVLRSFITKGTLNNNGIYVDRNFGKLPDWLKSKGYNVMILPMFFNLGVLLFSKIVDQIWAGRGVFFPKLPKCGVPKITDFW